MANCKTPKQKTNFLLPLATTTFNNALIHSEKISIKKHKTKKINEKIFKKRDKKYSDNKSCRKIKNML